MSHKLNNMSVWHRHEGLERSHIILGLLEQTLGYYDPGLHYEENRGTMHPSIWNEECGLLLAEAAAKLAELYQKIGEWETI